MALVTPIVNSIPALDATKANTITFTANGGDQIVKNEIQIVNNITETIVYTNIATTYVLGQTIPANILTNGGYYKVAFRTYDVLNNTSEWSNYQPFYCYSTPTLTFNVVSGQTINVSNFNLTLTYNQAQGERLEVASIYFYDANDNLISSSGNLFNNNTPPIVFNYPLNGLENNKIYKVKANATTVDNTALTTGLIPFYVNYQTIDTEGELYLTMDSCNGYINIRSAPIINAGGGYNDYNPDNLTYVEQDTMIDLTSIVGKVDTEDIYSPWVRWYDFLPVSGSFLFRLWFYPARTTFKVAELSTDDDSNHIIITYNRGADQDYLSFRTDDGISIDKGLGVFCNGNTRVFLWLRIIGESWEVITEIISNPVTALEWNNNVNNNIKYNVTTNIQYGNEPHGTFVPSASVIHAVSGNFDNIVIGNGVFDELNLSLNINLPYTPDIPDHDTSAVLFVHFTGSVANEATGNYTRAILQRKDNTTVTWWNIAEVDIPSDSSAVIEYDDYFIPNNIQQTYGLVIYTGSIPSESYTIDIIPKWGRVFLSDKDENYKLNYAVIYSGGSQNIQNGVLMPIGANYPTVIQNAMGNYKSGSLQFKVLGYQFEIDRTLDRNSIVKQADDILAFLTNTKPKCIKDYNGNIFICKVINSPQISYDANWGNGIIIISFDWVEQSKYNEYDGMTELGLIDVITS